MDYGKHVDLIGFDVVNNSKRPFQNLPDLRDAKFRDLASRQRERRDLLGAPGQAVGNALRVLRRIFRDVGVDGPQMVARRVRPMNLHLRPNSARSVSTLVVRPVWLSAKPDSMAWRT